MMKYNQLSEAIIKVPQILSSTVNKYVSSYLYFKLKQYLERLNIMGARNSTEEEHAQLIKNITQTMGKLQSKYNAQNISPESAKNIVNSSVTLPIDSDKFFDELNFKGVDENLRNMMRGQLKVELLITNESASSTRGSMETNSDFNFRIVVNAGSLEPRNALQSVNAIMSTAYHEMQHTVQMIAIKKISPRDEQLKLNPGYSDPDNALEYYSSGVEFTPQLGNVVDRVIAELEKQTLNSELPDDKNSAIKNAISTVMQDSKDARLFLISLYKSDKSKYSKVLKELYTKTSTVYDDFKQNGIDYAHTEMPSAELEANIEVLPSIYKLFNRKGDIFTVNQFGTDKNNLTKVQVFARKYRWKLDIAKNKNKRDSYTLALHFGDAEEQIQANALQTMNIAGKIIEQPWSEADDVLDAMELADLNLQEPTEENIKTAIEFVHQSAEYMGVDMKMTSSNSFTFLGLPFEIKQTPSKTKVEVISGDNIYLYLSLTQFSNLFMLFIRYADENPEEIKDIMINDGVYMSMINKLRNL